MRIESLIDKKIIESIKELEDYLNLKSIRRNVLNYDYSNKKKVILSLQTEGLYKS